MILMLTTIQLSALMFNLSCAGNPKRIVAKRTSFPCSVWWLWWWAEVPALRAVLPLGTSAATSAYEKSVLDTNGSWTGSNPGCTGVAGTTGPSGGTTAGKFRSNFRGPVLLTKFRYWTRRKWHRNLVRYYRYYRSPQRKYRPGGMKQFRLNHLKTVD